MGNLKAALNAVRKYFKDGVIDARVSHAMQMAFEAYDKDGYCNDSQCSCHVRSEPKPDYKLEAGARVKMNHRNGDRGTVLYVGPRQTMVMWDSDASFGWDSNSLTVIGPVTPEVGDYVQCRYGRGVIAPHDGDKTWIRGLQTAYVIAGSHFDSTFIRSEFTIICKGK